MPGLENKTEDKHDFDGECMPSGSQAFGNFSTFSVGIFRWLPKASGKGLKKSKVIYRVRGKVDNAELMYARAREVCKLFDKRPRWTSMKSETVK